MPVTTLRHAMLLALLGGVLQGCGPDESAISRDRTTADAEQEQPPVFTVSRHTPPTGGWMICDDGGADQGVMETVPPGGGTLTLDNGHLLTVGGNAVAVPTDFVFVEPRAREVVVYASGGGAGPFGGAGVRVLLSWENRTGCQVPNNPVIVRIRANGTLEELPTRPGSRSRTVETEDPLTELSTFAIAG